jgi:hypothetical protein
MKVALQKHVMHKWDELSHDNQWMLMLDFHRRRLLADEITEQQRSYHRRAARTLRDRLKKKKPASWNWQEFCEAYREG